MPTPRRYRLNWRRSCRTGRWGARSTATAQLLKPEFIVVLKPFERRLKLLISVLHLLNLPGELTDLILQSIDPDQKLCGADLRECDSRARGEIAAGHNRGKGGTDPHRSLHRPREEIGKAANNSQSCVKIVTSARQFRSKFTSRCTRNATGAHEVHNFSVQ